MILYSLLTDAFGFSTTYTYRLSRIQICTKKHSTVTSQRNRPTIQTGFLETPVVNWDIWSWNLNTFATLDLKLCTRSRSPDKNPHIEDEKDLKTIY